MAESTPKKETREGFRRLAKLTTPRKDQQGNDQLAVELIVKDGKTTNGSHFGLVVVHAPVDGKVEKVQREVVINRFSNDGDETFQISIPTGRKITIDGEEKDEYGPYLTGRVVNRADDDAKMSSVSMSLYSVDDIPKLLDGLAAAGDNKDERVKVYEQYQNQVWGFADRNVEAATNEFFGIKPSAAYVERMNSAASKEAAAEAPAPAPEAEAAEPKRNKPSF